MKYIGSFNLFAAGWVFYSAFSALSSGNTKLGTMFLTMGSVNLIMGLVFIR